eukprot:5003303-Pleurochrysis_carterae.AAC.2
MEPRAWVGMNLGRSLTTPGAYNIWVPSVPRVVLTSEVYFDESTYPWKPAATAANSTVATAIADTGADQPPGIPPGQPAPRPAPVDRLANQLDTT